MPQLFYFNNVKSYYYILRSGSRPPGTNVSCGQTDTDSEILLGENVNFERLPPTNGSVAIDLEQVSKQSIINQPAANQKYKQ